MLSNDRRGESALRCVPWLAGWLADVHSSRVTSETLARLVCYNWPRDTAGCPFLKGGGDGAASSTASSNS